MTGDGVLDVAGDLTKEMGVSTLLTGEVSTISSQPMLPESTTTFEPVLNVPAFSVFLFIAIVFGLLQYRMAAIGTAADRRTEALATLRRLKAKQLSSGGTAAANDKTADTVTDETESILLQATEEYRDALMEVERLRTVIPGLVRIPPPPAESASRERMEENVAAAKQFLNITLPPVVVPENEDSTILSKASGISKKGEGSTGLQPWFIVVLVFTLLAQISLLWLFTVGFDSLGTSQLFSGP